MREYKWEERTLGFMLEEKAVRVKDKPFLLYKDEKVTYGELNTTVNRVANRLVDWGLKKDDKICIMLTNVPDYIYIWFGAAKLGVAEVPINTAYKGDLLQYVVNNSDATVMVVDQQFLDRIEFIGDGFENLKHVIVYPELTGKRPKARFDFLSYKDFLSKKVDNPKAEVRPPDPMAIMYTSGTTGPSKGVIHSHMIYFGYGASQIKYARLNSDDILYACLPYFHAGSQALITYPALMLDATVVMVDRFSASGFWDDMRKYKVTYTVAVGAMFNFLMAQPESPGDADNPLRIFNGGPFLAEKCGAFEKRFGLKLLEFYGNIESGFVIRSPYDAHKPGSCGKAIDEYEVKLVDGDDREVPVGQVGEFVARSKEPWTMLNGYYKMPEKTAESFRNLWFHTGDGGRMDEEGYFYFVDRIKDAIRKRGENISSWEVEKVINSHPKIQESVAIGLKSKEWAEDEVKVVVVLKQGEQLSPEALIDYCEERMAYFAVPRFIEFKSSLPKTPTQRVEKYKLKEEGVTPNTWDRVKANYKLKQGK